MPVTARSVQPLTQYKHLRLNRTVPAWYGDVEQNSTIVNQYTQSEVATVDY